MIALETDDFVVAAWEGTRPRGNLAVLVELSFPAPRGRDRGRMATVDDRSDPRRRRRPHAGIPALQASQSSTGPRASAVLVSSRASSSSPGSSAATASPQAASDLGRAARGGRPLGSSSTGSPSSCASAPRRPPVVIATPPAPRSRAAPYAATVSSVSPEYEEPITTQRSSSRRARPNRAESRAAACEDCPWQRPRGRRSRRSRPFQAPRSRPVGGSAFRLDVRMLARRDRGGSGVRRTRPRARASPTGRVPPRAVARARAWWPGWVGGRFIFPPSRRLAMELLAETASTIALTESESHCSKVSCRLRLVYGDATQDLLDARMRREPCWRFARRVRGGARPRASSSPSLHKVNGFPARSTASTTPPMSSRTDGWKG